MKSWIRYLSGNRTGHVVAVDDSVASSEIACGMAERCAPPAAPAAPGAKRKRRKRKAAAAPPNLAEVPPMKPVGGGWWELFHGRRYKGKAAAARALKRLGG